MLFCNRARPFCPPWGFFSPESTLSLLNKKKNLLSQKLASQLQTRKYYQQRLKSALNTSSRRSLNFANNQSRHFIPWRIFSFSDAVSVKDEIIAGNTFEDILNVVEKRRSLMNPMLISEAFIKLSKIVENNDNIKVDNLFEENKSFADLCILAENLVSETSNDELIVILHSLYIICRDECLSLSNVVQSECHNRLHLFNHSQLSYVANWFHKRKQIKNHTLGQIAAIYQKELYQINDLETFARLMVAVMPICSQEFGEESLKQALCLIETSDPELVSAQTVKLILQTLVGMKNCHTAILKHCVNILLPRLMNLSLSDLGSIHQNLYFLGFSHKQINSSIRARFLKELPEIKEIKDIICAMQVLGPSLSSFVRHRLEQKLLANSQDISIEFIQGVCNGLRLMKYNLESPIMRKITNMIIEFSSDLTIYDLVRVCECLKNVDISPKDKIFDILTKRLLEILETAITPGRVKNVAYCLSLLPSESLDIMVIERLENMWSSFHPGDIHQIKKILNIFLERTFLSGYVKSRLQAFVSKVHSYSEVNICNFKSIVYLNQHLDYLMRSGAEKDILVYAMDQYSNCLYGLSPKMAVQSINRVGKSGYLQKDVLDRAAEVISDNLECISLNHILNLLIPYCVFDYFPASVPKFVDTCAEMILPFLEVLSLNHLLHLAYLLSLNGSFPEPLIRTIFSVEFLLKFDRQQINCISPKTKEINLHRLFLVNRSVVLQCPQYNIPWFHHDYSETFSHQGKKDRMMHPTIQEMKYYLTELCGGPSYLRTNVLTPYHYCIHSDIPEQ
ncbi:FAST kinase domain-containing protein 1, mitochondrial-like isoform X2 [Antedon mediterranea]|uniref:FAST kinase domain-containing protein 1, mitochondrial-like isoform X2 n=1 Tax=Antedon mediterranea TaxID=105859 RepID=UPI003AF8C0D7